MEGVIMQSENQIRLLPAYPLFVKDPNFSFWSCGDRLNENNVYTWYGEEKKLYGFLKAAGETYCFLGNAEIFQPFGVKKAIQTKLNVTAFATEYEFLCGEATLKIRFVSPLPPANLELLSMPVCYMDYEIISADSLTDAEISLFVNRSVAYNGTCGNANTNVRGLVASERGFEYACMGLKRQLPLSNNDDLIGADWGYFYLAGENAYFCDEKDLFAYLVSRKRVFTADTEEKYIAAIQTSESGLIAFAYDDILSIDYFGDFRKGYYLEDHSIADALADVFRNRAKIEKELNDFEKALKKKAEKFGNDYENVLFASLRQSVAAHKLVKDKQGNVLFLSKECNSNGCIGTVDVSYPSMPLYLLYNPELVKGMMRPILKFAKMPVWNYDFAPHDVGTYPACCGQVYGLAQKESRFGDYLKNGYPETHFPVYQLPAEFNAYDFNMQMPVEECANMLIMFLGCYRCDGDISFFEKELSLCEKWVEYLVKYGLKPQNQLCTDDFAGHLADNLNLAIKATVGIAAYAELVRVVGKADMSEKYRKIAEEFAAEISAFADGKTHLPLTWSSDDETFSLKYNLVFDKIFSLGLFKQELLEREVSYYLSKAERYGVPLDSRKMYTKSDWLMWAAKLTDDVEKQKKFVGLLNVFLKESPDRVPFGDWFETENGVHHEFRARSVQGGCFILLM